MAELKIAWPVIFSKLRASLKKTPLPSVSAIAAARAEPFRVLVSTMISLRTKDAVTMQAAERLFEQAGTPRQLAALSQAEIAALIYPAGFYKTKAFHLKAVAELLITRYNSRVPAELAALLTFPGVGRKTANLVLNLGYGIKAICVDTHVHRISNRIGWVTTKSATETEFALMKILPDRYWIEINELLVRFGQQICKPVAPLCSCCPIPGYCHRIGVQHAR